MTMPNRFRGFFSIDAMLSMLMLVMIALFLAQASMEISSKSQRQFSDQQAFDKIVSVADHSVKIGASVHGDGIRHPNWIEPAAITESYVESLRERTGLSRLYIGLREADGGYRFCIYRLVVVGPERQVARLFVCGE